MIASRTWGVRSQTPAEEAARASTSVAPEADPALAVIVACPLPAAITNPVASTVATVVSLELQVTVAPAITRPFWSITSAASFTFALKASNSTAAGLTAISVGAPAGGEVGASTRPHPFANATATNKVHRRIIARLDLTIGP